MWISDAYAQADGAAGAGGSFAFPLMMVALFAIFYFLMIRPQQKKIKEHKAMIAAVRRHDKVVTGGGLIGVVTRVDEHEVEVEIAADVKVKVLKATLQDVMSKTSTPGAGDRNGKNKKNDNDDAPANDK